MSLPTLNDVQAVDPVLTNMLVGYMQADTRFVADRVFPGVSVDKDSGTYYVFTKKYWFRDEMQVRAPGTPFALGGFGVETATYSTLQYGLGKPIADEERANSQVPMDLEKAATMWLAQQILIRKERMWAADFMAASVWGGTDNNSVTDWDDYTSGDPVANIQAQKRVISANTGLTPNQAVMGEVVHDALALHPDIIDRIKYTTAATQMSIENALAAVFGLSSWVVGRASYTASNEATAAASVVYSAIIDDDFLLLHNNPSAGLFGATAGKTFNWDPGGGMGVALPVKRDDDSLSDVLRVRFQIDQKVTASDLGYIWLDIV